MYCGKNKIALCSQKQIAQVLLDLLREGRDFSSISISELCRLAGVSRQTFYSLFQSKENVLTWLLENGVGLPDTVPCAPPDLPTLCRGYSTYICDNRDILTVIVNSDLLYLLRDLFTDSLSECACMPEEDSALHAYTVDFLGSGLCGIIRRYVLRGATETQPELERICLQLFDHEIC